MARFATVQPCDRLLFLRAAHGVPEVDFNLVFQVAAWLVLRVRRNAAAPAKELAEEAAKARSAPRRSGASAEIESAKITVHAGFACACPSGIACARSVIP